MGQPKVASATWRDRTKPISRDFYETVGQHKRQTRALRSSQAWDYAKTPKSRFEMTSAIPSETRGKVSNFSPYGMAVNKIGDVVTGFSGSSVNDYIGTYHSGMLASGNSPSPPIRYFAGKDWFGGTFGSFPAWGEYSYTSLDPD